MINSKTSSSSKASFLFWCFVLVKCMPPQPQEVFYKKAVLKHFTIFIGKHLCWSLFLLKLQVWKTAILLKRDSNIGVFLWILQNFWIPILKNICEWLLLYMLWKSSKFGKLGNNITIKATWNNNSLRKNSAKDEC